MKKYLSIKSFTIKGLNSVILVVTVCLLFPVSAYTQGVSINSTAAQPNASAILDINDGQYNSRGMLVPRMTSSQRAGVTGVTGLIIYNNTDNIFNYYDGSGWKVPCATTTGVIGATGSQTVIGSAINTDDSSPDQSSIFDVKSTNKGILIPRLTSAQRNALSPVQGLTIYNTDTKAIEYYYSAVWYKLENSSVSITGQPQNASTCAGTGTPQFTITVTGATNYQWQVYATSSWADITEGAPYSNVNTATLTITNPPVGMNGYKYRCHITAPCDAISDGTATLTVTATPAAPVITTSTICAGTTSLSGTSVSGAGIIVYAGASQIGSGTASGTSWTITVSPAFVATNSITATATASGCLSLASSPVTVNTTPAAPVITTSPICAGTTSLSGTSLSGAGIIVYAGASQIGSGTASGTSWTITVSPAFVATNSITATATASGCVSLASSPVTVNATPTALSLTGSTICTSPGNDGTITSSTSVSGISYQLYNSSNAPVLAAQTGTNGVLTWSTLTAGNGYYVIGTSSGCSSTSNSVNVATTASPAAPTASVTQPTCTVSTGTITITAPTGTGMTYSIGGAYQSSGTFTSVAANTYTATAKNSTGCISSGTSVTISTQPTITYPSGWACGGATMYFTDGRDSKTYNTVLIGAQCWMKENLNVGTYVTAATGQGATGIQKYCYNNTESKCTSYGGLYTWPEMMDGSAGCNGSGSGSPACATKVRGICPCGWHIPSHYEWTTLLKSIHSCTGFSFTNDYCSSWGFGSYQGMEGTDEGRKLKAASTSWDGTNTTGFTGLPCGEWEGGWYGEGFQAVFWTTSDNAPNCSTYTWWGGLSSAPTVDDNGYSSSCCGCGGYDGCAYGSGSDPAYQDYWPNNNGYALSVRCIKDN